MVDDRMTESENSEQCRRLQSWAANRKLNNINIIPAGGISGRLIASVVTSQGGINEQNI